MPAATVRIDAATGISLYGRISATARRAAAVGIEAATFLLPETAEQAPYLNAQLRENGEGSSRPGFEAGTRLSSHGRRGKDHGEEEDEDNALRKGETSHRVLSEAAPGAGRGWPLGRLSTEPGLPEANKFILGSTGMTRQGGRYGETG